MAPDYSATTSSRLFHGHIDEIFVLESQLLGSVIWRNALAINHESHLGGLQTQAAAVSIHQLAEGRRLLDLELHLAALLILDLQLDVRSGLAFRHVVAVEAILVNTHTHCQHRHPTLNTT
eukprot:TRINITY_DN2109_c0_g1_i5.p1 TRINITY_DN2109_c0_g1~~TRINITY_DN2109_c0_g1_i5.p1  ORF type:complete len:120 (+),score=10.01 TRINITY_DN2109_c0_g1_i5:85-444(+)